MLWLNVPHKFEHEQAALKKGAYQSENGSGFYTRTKDSYPLFLPWIINQGNIVVCDRFYLVQSVCVCPHCKTSTRVVMPALGSYFDLTGLQTRADFVGRSVEDLYHIGISDLHFCAPMYPIPSRVYEWANKTFSFSVERLEDFPREQSVMARCDRCGTPITFQFLLEHNSSPFSQMSEKKAERLQVYEFTIAPDIVVHGRIHPISLQRSWLHDEQVIPLDADGAAFSYSM